MLTRVVTGARFVLSAGLVWGVDLLTFALLYRYTGVAAAVFVSRAVGGVVGFFAHKHFSFRNSSRYTVSEVIKFSILWLVNYGLSLAGVTAIIVTSGADPTLAKASVDLVIFLANYLMMAKIFRL